MPGIRKTNGMKAMLCTHKMTLRLLVCALFMLYSCKYRRPHTSDAQTKYSFLNNGSHLITRVKDPDLKVCVKGVGREVSDVEREMVKVGLDYWLAPLREIDQSITQRVSFECGTLNTYLTVRFHSTYGRSHAYVNSTGVFTSYDLISIYAGANESHGPMSSTEAQGILIHELGHAFGLADLYLEKPLSVQKGQPYYSVMCEPTLYKDAASAMHDDRSAILISYAAFYAKNVRYDSSDRLSRQLAKVTARTGGDLADACFYQQQNVIYKAISEEAYRDKTVLTRLLSLVGDEHGHVIRIRADDQQWVKEKKRAQIRPNYLEFIISQSHQFFPDPDDQIVQVHRNLNSDPTPDVECRILSLDGVTKVLRRWTGG